VAVGQPIRPKRRVSPLRGVSRTVLPARQAAYLSSPGELASDAVTTTVVVTGAPSREVHLRAAAPLNAFQSPELTLC
jgi:hypothetical protein